MASREARDMGLEAEAFRRGERRRAVADYVLRHPDGQIWEQRLAKRLTTPRPSPRLHGVLYNCAPGIALSLGFSPGVFSRWSGPPANPGLPLNVVLYY